MNEEHAFLQQEVLPLHGDDAKLRIERIAAVELPSSQAILLRRQLAIKSLILSTSTVNPNNNDVFKRTHRHVWLRFPAWYRAADRQQDLPGVNW